MISYTELKKGMIIVYENEPYEILENHFLRMQQRKAVAQVKMKNLANGKVLSRNFQASDYFEEAEIEEKKAVFIYSNRQEYWFHEEGNPKKRFSVKEEVIGNQAKFLKPQTVVSVILFEGKIIKIILPIKIDFKVISAPPAIKGGTVSGGSKIVTLEGGAQISVPLFINEGDIIRVNTELGEYTERVNND
jgi:elongation factor P